MSGPLRENGPGLLVPLAWSFATAVHLDLAGTHALTVAHGVMATIIALFTVSSWSEMTGEVIRAWRDVLVAGFLVTVAGLAGLLGAPRETALQAVSLYGWMLLPAVGLAYTGLEVPSGSRVNLGGAALAVAGTAVYAVGSLGGTGLDLAVPGLVLVGIGQTAGIADAVYRY